MKLSDFDYNLPKELIAQEPIKPRDHSRLLVLDKKVGEIKHKHFYDTVDYLKKGDVLVLNNSKVFPARLIGSKKETRGKIEVFLTRQIKNNIWQCLIGGRGARVGLQIEFPKKLIGEVLINNNDGTWEVKFNKKDKELMNSIYKIGKVPLPPYIKREDYSIKNDLKNYQTVFAKITGSVAAPTAGLHFTPALLKKIKAKGVQIEYVTLHVGLGTFAPVKVDDITKHKMHAEWVEIKKEVMQEIIQAKKEKRRIIAVGTTSVRTLESICHPRAGGDLMASIASPKIPAFACLRRQAGTTNKEGWTNIFIYPGYKFKVVDAMITNFHLPKSSLIMLVSAFAGQQNTRKAYQAAIKKKYRFYSYGDAMFIC